MSKPKTITAKGVRYTDQSTAPFSFQYRAPNQSENPASRGLDFLVFQLPPFVLRENGYKSDAFSLSSHRPFSHSGAFFSLMTPAFPTASKCHHRPHFPVLSTITSPSPSTLQSHMPPPLTYRLFRTTLLAAGTTTTMLWPCTEYLLSLALCYWSTHSDSFAP